MNSRYKGFTLIELLVVMAIIGILAATAMVNFGKNADRDVRQEKDRLTSFLREVQNKALAGDRAGIPAGRKVCGFGVRQQEDTDNIESFYVYTTDVDGDCLANWKTYAITENPSYETFYPSSGIAFSLTGNVFFLAPNGDVACDGCTLPASVTIAKGGYSIDATIDAAGRIY